MFPTKEYDGRVVAACPKCGETVTHIDHIYIDDAAGNNVHVLADDEDEYSFVRITSTAQRDKYEGRRHTITIYMECEMCGAESSVSLMQHKGATFVTTT